jgi:hypothetical protein
MLLRLIWPMTHNHKFNKLTRIDSTQSKILLFLISFLKNSYTINFEIIIKKINYKLKKH